MGWKEGEGRDRSRGCSEEGCARGDGSGSGERCVKTPRRVDHSTNCNRVSREVVYGAFQVLTLSQYRDAF